MAVVSVPSSPSRNTSPVQKRSAAADEPWLDRLPSKLPNLVFIMGDHRSGTTLLYQLLAGSGAFNHLTAYHVLRHDELLANHFAGRTEAARRALNDEFRSLGLTTRLIDNVKLTADMPEEYGFVLHARTGRAVIDERSRPLFEQVCRKAALISDEPTKPLLLKNPMDYGYFVRVLRMFPEARLIFLHRHPLAIINSQLKSIYSGLAEKNPYLSMLTRVGERIHRRPLLRKALLWASDPQSSNPWTRRMTVRSVKSKMDYFVNNVDRLPSSCYVSLRYEDLCRDADGQIGRILDFLGLPAAPRAGFQGSISPRPMKLVPGVESAKSRIVPRFQQLLDYHGYGPEPADG